MLIGMFLLGIVLLFFIASCIISAKLEKMPLPNDPVELRRYLLLRLIFGVFLTHVRFDPYRDLQAIWHYDRRYQKGKYAPRPTMLTTEGSQLFHAFCVIYSAEEPDHSSAAACATIPNWHCLCGRENAGYTSTCVCGKNRCFNTISSTNKKVL